MFRLHITSTTRRYLSTGEIATALRPFYFTVHPDLFGKYPQQQQTNENSLKHLSQFLQNILNKRSVNPLTIKFYLRNKEAEGEFTNVSIHLRSRDVRTAVLNVLKACNLPTSYVESVKETVDSKSTQTNKYDMRNFTKRDFDFSKITEDDPIYGEVLMRKLMKLQKESITLSAWIKQNEKRARFNTIINEPIRDEIQKLRANICDELQLRAIEWECGWDISHFRGCLQAFRQLAKHHARVMDALRERTLVFAPFTGVSLEGDVLLNSGEVRNNWLDLIKNVRGYDKALKKVPHFERGLSIILRDIQIGRRKFMPKVMVEEYEKHLRFVMTSLNDYKTYQDYPSHWPETLAKYELVVETEAGPMMLSPTGQFIVPSSCPGSFLVNFISENMSEADRRLTQYKIDKPLEKTVHRQVMDALHLKDMRKDDCITPQLMIACCERLLANRVQLQHLNQLSLFVTKYYSVMTDGVMCIPWDWKL